MKATLDTLFQNFAEYFRDTPLRVDYWDGDRRHYGSGNPAFVLHLNSKDGVKRALRNGAPFKDWVLPAGLTRVRQKLGKSDDADRQMVKILTTVLTDGLPAVEAACGEALDSGVHSADVVLNILARQREVIQPLTIATPDALKLRHEPVADCARYDRLRRAV